MREYIKREAALRVLCDACGNAACPKGLIPRCSYYEKMQSVPAADVRPVVRGKWKLGGYGQISDATEKWYDQFFTGGFLYCSACKERSSVKTNYCPNCGADMRKGGAVNG